VGDKRIVLYNSSVYFTVHPVYGSHHFVRSHLCSNNGMKQFFLAIIAFLVFNGASAQTLRIAVYQYADNPRIKNLQPLADHLQQQAGINASVKSYPTVHALIKGMQENEVDVAFISTFGYLLLKGSDKKHPMLPVAALVAPGAKDNYKTAIVSRKQANIDQMHGWYL
jgi:ABC-type phosphate/phosphonate transport system substrate-binding protein